jgi:hypothetical protein
MAVDYSLDPEDIACARLLAIGVRPRLEFAVFAVGLAALLAWSVSPWTFTMLPLLIGLTAGLGGFRLMQIAKVRQASQAAYDRNPTLRRRTGAAWDDRGITIQPSGASPELIPWGALQRLRENQRIVLLLQTSGQFHAIPKRAFSDEAELRALRLLARRLATVPRRVK